MATKNEVLKFIDKFKFIHKKEIEEVFTTGNCYYFALILKERFDEDRAMLEEEEINREGNN